MNNKLRITISIILALVFFVAAQPDVLGQSKPKSKFYDFGAQIIDGEIKKPTALYTDTKKRVKFGRLLRLKKSFIPQLMTTSKERTFK
jgi:hypothetical protein